MKGRSPNVDAIPAKPLDAVPGKLTLSREESESRAEKEKRFEGKVIWHPDLSLKILDITRCKNKDHTPKSVDKDQIKEFTFDVPEFDDLYPGNVEEVPLEVMMLRSYITEAIKNTLLEGATKLRIIHDTKKHVVYLLDDGKGFPNTLNNQSINSSKCYNAADIFDCAEGAINSSKNKSKGYTGAGLGLVPLLRIADECQASIYFSNSPETIDERIVSSDYKGAVLCIVNEKNRMVVSTITTVSNVDERKIDKNVYSAIVIKANDLLSRRAGGPSEEQQLGTRVYGTFDVTRALSKRSMGGGSPGGSLGAKTNPQRSIFACADGQSQSAKKGEKDKTPEKDETPENGKIGGEEKPSPSNRS